MMPRYFAVIALVVGLMLAASPAHAWRENVLYITHHSKVLDRQKSFSVYMPSDAHPDETFATVFVLHGAYGSHHDWLELTRIATIAEAFRMILVFPNGDQFGWYVDSPHDSRSRMESYVAGELVELVDQMFPTTGTAEGRGIMGLSMGGHGALVLAARNPDVFTSASSLSGILDITQHGGKWEIDHRLGPLDENRERWMEHSVYYNAEAFRDFPHPILFDCGVDDFAIGAVQDNRALHARLRDLGIPHIYRELPGDHNWDYWSTHVESHLNYHMGNLLEASTGMGGWHAHYYKRIAQFHRENAEATVTPREGTIVTMIGSSSVEGFPARLLPDYTIVNRGIVSDTIGLGKRGLSHRLHDAVFDIPSDVIVMKMSRNDLGDRARNGSPSMEEILREYERVVRGLQYISPRAHIIVVSSFPTRDRYEHLADDVREFNEMLRPMAERVGVIYLDVWSEMVEESGSLIRYTYTSDGLHLSSPGQQLWAQRLAATIKELQAKPRLR